MTREEFDRLYLGKAVHCDTEEKANEFLALADSVGYNWVNGKSLIEENFWEEYKKETCYEVKNGGFMYCDVDFYKNNYQIIEYQRQSKFKVGDKVRVKGAYTPINEKVEEQIRKEEAIDDIIEEIEYHQKAINVLLNILKRKAKVK